MKNILPYWSQKKNNHKGKKDMLDLENVNHSKAVFYEKNMRHGPPPRRLNLVQGWDQGTVLSKMLWVGKGEAEIDLWEKIL